MGVSLTNTVRNAVGVSMMSVAEIRWCATAAGGHERIVEVGSWRGGTTKAMASQSPGTVTSVDTCEGVWFAHGDVVRQFKLDKGLGDFETIDGEYLDGIFRDYLVTEIASGKVIVLREESVKAAREFTKASVDMVFIDADHEYDSVIADINAWLPKLETGGMICGHDYAPRNPGVFAAVNDLLPDATNPVDSIWAHVVG